MHLRCTIMEITNENGFSNLNYQILIGSSNPGKSTNKNKSILLCRSIPNHPNDKIINQNVSCTLHFSGINRFKHKSYIKKMCFFTLAYCSYVALNKKLQKKDLK